MNDLPRVLPDPLPAIHPVPEYAVTGARAALYADVKAVLQVPWMGVVTMAFAHYEQFFGALWQGLRPIAASAPFVAACRDLRRFVESEVATLAPSPRAAWLAEQGYGAREIESIRAMVELFSHGNYPYLIIASYARLLLNGEAVGPQEPAAPFDGRHAPNVTVPFVLMERHHADAPTQAVYDDIMATLGLPFVNTDYRALARWPTYFAQAWTDLKPSIASDTRRAIMAAAYARSLEIARTLPNPAGLNPDPIIDAARRDAPIEEPRAVAQLFHTLLPGLVTNVAYFRAQL